MGITIVVGGQYGSEGKGKATQYMARTLNAAAIVKVGGTNSGHTIYDQNGHPESLRQLPVSAVMPDDDIVSVLAAGSYIDLDVLFSERDRRELPDTKLKIDHNAVIMDYNYMQYEANFDLRTKIGSTLSGTGNAVAARVMRTNTRLADQMGSLSRYLCDTKKYLNNLLECNKNIIIEGTQGYGLSNYHTKAYPFATSRDTTAAGFLSEVGLSPFDVDNIVMVIRAFPIRVAGNSGPLKYEISWDDVSRESGSDCYFEEKTTVTRKIRRVAKFDPELVKEAIIANKPNIIVLNHVDYIDMKNGGNDILSYKQNEFIHEVEDLIGNHIKYIGNGPTTIIER